MELLSSFVISLCRHVFLHWLRDSVSLQELDDCLFVIASLFERLVQDTDGRNPGCQIIDAIQHLLALDAIGEQLGIVLVSVQRHNI